MLFLFHFKRFFQNFSIDFVICFSKARFSHYCGLLCLSTKTRDQGLPAISSSATANSSVYYDVMQAISVILFIRRYDSDGDDVLSHAARKVRASYAGEDNDSVSDIRETAIHESTMYLILRILTRSLKCLII